jgi:crotonobetainyl-CoA:carnitine CoA-transferase CaiB-like acyl-CoA transferase
MEMNPVMEHSTIGRLQVPGVPIHFDKTPGEIRSAPPTLGQHTEEVLREIGYNDAGIAALRKDGVIHDGLIHDGLIPDKKKG